MRVIAGRWRGRRLGAPAGDATRPTADRARQALFDRLTHAPWGGRAMLDGANVLDAFAGSGALGIEALSRGAAQAIFMENDRAALAALRGNLVACGAERQNRVIAGDVLHPPPGEPCGLVFLDPPYRRGLAAPAVAALCAAGWVAEGALLILETAADETLDAAAAALGEPLAAFAVGVAAIRVFRVGLAAPSSKRC